METGPKIYTLPTERVINAFGDRVEVYFSGEETEGKFVQCKLTVPPGGGPPLHYHTREDEWFYVLSGQLSFFLNDTWQEVGVGTRVSCPRNNVHTFKNNTAQPVEMLFASTPSGFEVFFGRCAEEFARPGGPREEHLLEIAAEHGIHFIR